MKALFLAAAIFVNLIAAVAVKAQDGAALATAKGCMNCHAVDERKAGPAFKDVAAKYAGNATAESTLVSELRDGKGHPKVAASDAELQSVVAFVLSTSK
ncbi:MAG: c-type cytochrome [Xanthobacteraceae bacterium]